ncbi:hypothetical protein [Rhodococcoides fascians]|uniref:hypothetical protein n=1 Tax=Rhodococcoides fascians TaxID=1828 RepID=UPI00117A70F1|nr:hypothetical protein [Rhodococcus fascians]
MRVSRDDSAAIAALCTDVPAESENGAHHDNHEDVDSYYPDRDEGGSDQFAQRYLLGGGVSVGGG